MTTRALRVAARFLTANEDESWSDHDRSAPGTPWGPAQSAYDVAPGVRFFETASHGGLGVSGHAVSLLSSAARQQGFQWHGSFWFEEDSAVLVPLWEMDAWLAVLHRKMGITSSKDVLARSIERGAPEYFEAMIASGKTGGRCG